MQEYLQQLLYRSYTTSSNEQIQELTSTFSYLEAQPGYITALAQISNHANGDVNLRCAAIAQLKNCMRAHWQPNPFHPGRFTVFEEDKQFLKDNIIKLNKELCKDPKLARLAKDVIYFMGDDVLPLLPEISEDIKKGDNLKQCLNFLLGAVENYRRGANQSSDRVNEFLGWTVPSIALMVDIKQDNLMKTYQMLQGTQNEEGWTQYKRIKLKFEEALYLCFKYMKKMIKHISRKEEYRGEAFKWATISINILREQDEQMNSLNVERCYRDFRHSTREFIYFHRKKWAVKYLTHFLESTLIYKRESRKLNEETNKFYGEEWECLKETLRDITHRPTTSNIRMLELRLVGNCFKVKPARMESEFRLYMFQKLPELIIFDNEYRELAIQRPAEFLLLEDNEPSDSHLMRIFAGQLWISIANHMAGLKRNQVQPYKLCLEFIREKAQQPKFLYLAVNLFLRLSKEIDRPYVGNSQVSVLLAEEMAHVANTFVSSLLSFPEQYLFINKAIDVFAQYKKVLSSENIRAIQELVSTRLSSKEVFEGHEVVRIKSMIVFGDMETVELDQEAIQYFLGLYIEMINAYEIDRLTFSFQSFILKNHKKIRNYVVPIIQIVSQKFYTALNDKDNEQSTEKHHFINKFNTTEGFINIMAILSDIVSKDTPEVKEKIEQEIVKLLDCYFNFGEGIPEQIYQYQSVIFSFFTRYMISLRSLLLAPGDDLAFYLHLMLINLVGLPYITLDQIKKDITLPPAKKKALMSCYNQEKYNIGRNLKLCFTYLPFMPMPQRVIRTEQIETNFLNSFFLEKIVYMVSVFYQSCTKEEEVKGKIATTLMLIKLLEEYQEKILDYLLPHIWMVICLNSEDSQIKKYLKIYNIQLVCLLLWTMGLEKIHEYFRGEQEVLYNLIYQIVSKGELNLGDRKMFREESRRIVLGLSEMLRLAAIHQLVGKKAPEIFKWLLRYTEKIFEEFNSDNDQMQDYEVELGDKTKALEWEDLMVKEGMGHQIRKYKEQNQLQDIENEPNLVITMDAFNINDNDLNKYDGDYDLEDLMDPECLYSDSIPSGLDSIQEGQHLFKALVFFMAKQPQTYGKLVNVYGFLLEPILYQLDVEEDGFQKLLDDWINLDR